MHPFPHFHARCDSCGAELPAGLHARYCDDCWARLVESHARRAAKPSTAAGRLAARIWRSIARYWWSCRPPGRN